MISNQFELCQFNINIIQVMLGLEGFNIILILVKLRYTISNPKLEFKRYEYDLITSIIRNTKEDMLNFSLRL